MKPEEWVPPKEPMTPDEFERNVMSAAATYRRVFKTERPPKPSVAPKEPGLSAYDLWVRECPRDLQIGGGIERPARVSILMSGSFGMSWSSSPEGGVA